MTRSRDIADQQENLGGAVAPFVAGKNKVINGDFGIWQRGTSFTNPTIFSYTADRWQTIVNGSPTYSVSRQTFTPGTAPVAGYESSYFLRQNVTSATGASVIVMAQTIEDVRTFAGQTVTFSFWAKADATRTWSLNMDQGFGTGGSTSVRTAFGTISVTTSWQRFSLTATLPSVAGKTIGANSFLHVLFFGPGETVQTMDIWGVQVEAGSVATPFTTASGSIGGELALCQRYYWRANYDASTNYVFGGSGGGNSSTQARTTVFFPVMMRTKPTTFDYATISKYAIFTYADGQVTPTGVSMDTNLTNSNVAYLAWTASSGLTANALYYVRGNNDTSAYLGFGAEL